MSLFLRHTANSLYQSSIEKWSSDCRTTEIFAAARHLYDSSISHTAMTKWQNRPEYRQTVALKAASRPLCILGKPGIKSTVRLLLFVFFQTFHWAHLWQTQMRSETHHDSKIWEIFSRNDAHKCSISAGVPLIIDNFSTNLHYYGSFNVSSLLLKI